MSTHQEKVINQINKYFILQRDKHIIQNVNYNPNDSDTRNHKLYYVPKNRHKKNIPITDATLVRHLNGVQTCGIYADTRSKFIAFDVDTDKTAKRDTLKLIQILQEEFNIKKKHIYPVFSGNKGYHLYLFIDKPVEVETLKKFYIDVLNKTQFNTNQVEYRPSKQAIKLPLGKHPKTSKVSYFCNPTDLKQIRSSKPIFNINTLDSSFFYNYKDKYIELFQQEEQTELTDVVEATNLSREEIEAGLINVRKLLETNELQYPNTRNQMTLITASYLRTIGKDKAYTKEVINSIMKNTKRIKPNYIETPLEQIEAKTSQVVDTVFKLGYTFGTHSEVLQFGIDEIKDMLSIEGFHLKQLYFIMLVHSKRHANPIDDTFYMSHSTASKYGANPNRSDLINQIDQLADRVEVVSRNVVDKEKSLANGTIVKQPNTYKIIKKYNPNATNIKIATDKAIEFEQFLYHLHTTNVIDVRKYISKNKFYQIKRKCG